MQYKSPTLAHPLMGQTLFSDSFEVVRLPILKSDEIGLKVSENNNVWSIVGSASIEVLQGTSICFWKSGRNWLFDLKLLAEIRILEFMASKFKSRQVGLKVSDFEVWPTAGCARVRGFSRTSNYYHTTNTRPYGNLFWKFRKKGHFEQVWNAACLPHISNALSLMFF